MLTFLRRIINRLVPEGYETDGFHYGSNPMDKAPTMLIAWTPAMRDNLRKAYDEAVAHESDQFTFAGHVFVTSYAKYLLEHLDGVFKSVSN